MNVAVARICLGLGVICGLLFVFGLVMQLETTEAFLLGTGQVSIGNPNWGILWQPIELAQGQLSADLAAACFVAFLVEVVYCLVMFGGEILMETIEHGNKIFSRWFKLLAIVMVVGNGVFDYNYGAVPRFGTWGHILFAACVAFAVGVCGLACVACFLKSWKHA